jgi:hypothetical protein
MNRRRSLQQGVQLASQLMKNLENTERIVELSSSSSLLSAETEEIIDEKKDNDSSNDNDYGNGDELSSCSLVSSSLSAETEENFSQGKEEQKDNDNYRQNDVSHENGDDADSSLFTSEEMKTQVSTLTAEENKEIESISEVSGEALELTGEDDSDDGIDLLFGLHSSSSSSRDSKMKV